MEKYAGRYTNEMYGVAVVSFKNGEISLNIVGLGWVEKLDYWQYDTFRATWRAPERDKSFVTFTLTPSGDVSTLRVDGLADFVPVLKEDAGVCGGCGLMAMGIQSLHPSVSYWFCGT